MSLYCLLYLKGKVSLRFEIKKKDFALSQFPFLFMSCGQKQSGAANGDVMDIITVTDNGVTYSDTIIHQEGGIVLPGGAAPAVAGAAVEAMESPMMQCTIHKSADKSVFALNFNNPTPHFPVSIAIVNAIGPIDGIGVFRAKSVDTGNALAAISTFSETFGGGQKYTVDSVMVNITKASGNTILGNYQLWVSNASGSKTVKGTINWSSGGVE